MHFDMHMHLSQHQTKLIQVHLHVHMDIQRCACLLFLKATIHGATLLLATVVTRLWHPCSRVVTAWLQPG